MGRSEGACEKLEGGDVNIAPGLGLGPLAFMASQENKSPQETECGAHTCVCILVNSLGYDVHGSFFACAYSCA